MDYRSASLFFGFSLRVYRLSFTMGSEGLLGNKGGHQHYRNVSSSWSIYSEDYARRGGARCIDLGPILCPACYVSAVGHRIPSGWAFFYDPQTGSLNSALANKGCQFMQKENNTTQPESSEEVYYPSFMFKEIVMMMVVFILVAVI